MINGSMGGQKRSVPKTLEACMATDYEMDQLQSFVEKTSLLFGYICMGAMFLYGAYAGYIESEYASSSDAFKVFLAEALPWFVCAVVVGALFDYLRNVVYALMKIAYNTNVMVNVDMFCAHRNSPDGVKNEKGKGNTSPQVAASGNPAFGIIPDRNIRN